MVDGHKTGIDILIFHYLNVSIPDEFSNENSVVIAHHGCLYLSLIVWAFRPVFTHVWGVAPFY